LAHLLSGRRIIAAGLWLLVAVAAFSACGDDGGGGGLPSTVRVAADPQFADAVLAKANELLAPYGITVEPTDAVEQADMLVVPNPSGDSTGASTYVTRYWVPVTGLSNPATSIGMDQLGAAVGGRLTNWSEVSGEEALLRVAASSDPPAPLAYWWPQEASTAQLLAVDTIREQIDADPHVLALMPLDAVDARVRSLAVDGVDVVFGFAAGYPLVEIASIAVRQSDNIELSDLLNNVAIQMAGELAAPEPTPITMRATGDILPVRCAYARQQELGDPIHAFRELAPWLAEADITVGSLDAAISDAGVPFDCVETFSLLAPEESLPGIELSGFDVITVATNHVKDCGQGACGDDAFFDTLSNLRSVGVMPVGGGADLAEARAPAILTVDGVRFAFLGYDEIAPYYHAEPGVPGTAPLDETYLREDIAAAKQQADVVVVLPQWGIEYQAEPTYLQQQLAAAAVDAGATLVIGNHPHWVEAAEPLGESFVAYALGNYIFDQDWSLETQQGVLLEAAFDGAKLKGVRFHPIHIWDEHQPAFAEPDEAAQIMDRIWTASASLLQ
jgi:poly-gamma-glutamate synthesis protein (capsule biosynthesis protein)